MTLQNRYYRFGLIILYVSNKSGTSTKIHQMKIKMLSEMKPFLIVANVSSFALSL